MQRTALAICALSLVLIFSFAKKPQTTQAETIKKFTETKVVPKKIQAAILLDVSNSMDGLIEQAKTQLWNMVNTLGRVKCDDNSKPQIEVSLYEYGRSSNSAANGYVKQLVSFTQDLDSISKILFNLNTNGGEEYCGKVIYTSLDELKWNEKNDQYKVIFIAGNEDFLQGNVTYTAACAKAKEKGVIVNTIYCGDRMQGIREHWNLLGECGNGSFTNINQNEKIIDIPTPYDSTLIVLNNRLNATYIAYGAQGKYRANMQKEVDEANATLGNGMAAQRAAAKSMSNAYNNESWDLVDAVKSDKDIINKLDKKTLPDNLKNKSNKDLLLYIEQKQADRSAIQKEMQTVNEKRNVFIADAKKKMATNGKQTLESAIETSIREQVKRFKMQIP
ncbi:MAG TPA: vWA domain-containing protein [Chitinophagaceae bacterium]|nr:vWA domain-containing protein [Chitinophagaceae bacterium]